MICYVTETFNELKLILICYNFLYSMHFWVLKSTLICVKINSCNSATIDFDKLPNYLNCMNIILLKISITLTNYDTPFFHILFSVSSLWNSTPGMFLAVKYCIDCRLFDLLVIFLVIKHNFEHTYIVIPTWILNCGTFGATWRKLN